MIKIKPEKIESLIKNSNGGFFNIVFKKADNTTRIINTRLGVKIGVKGTGHKLKPETPVLRVLDLIIYKNNIKKGLNPVNAAYNSYRSIRLDRVISFNTNKKKYIVDR